MLSCGPAVCQVSWRLTSCSPSQALSCLPGELCELLRSLHIHGLRNNEVLLLKDSRRLAERKDAGVQVDGMRSVLKLACYIKQKWAENGGRMREVRVSKYTGLSSCVQWKNSLLTRHIVLAWVFRNLVFLETCKHSLAATCFWSILTSETSNKTNKFTCPRNMQNCFIHLPEVF